MAANIKQFITDLYNGLVAFYPDSIFGREKGRLYGIARLWTDSTGKKWKSSEFAIYVMNWTSTQDIDLAADRVKKWKITLDQDQPPSPDMPPLELIEEAQEIDKEVAPSEERKKRQLLKSQRYTELRQTPRKKEAVPSQIQPKVQEEPKVPDLAGKKVILEPVQLVPTVELNDQEAQALESLISSAQSDPRAFTEETVSRINSALVNSPESIRNTFTPQTVQMVAISFTGRLIDIGNQFEKDRSEGKVIKSISIPNPVWMLSSIANPNDPQLRAIIPNEKSRLELCRKVQEMALALESDSVISHSLLEAVVGEKIADATIGQLQPATYRINLDFAKGVEIDLGEIKRLYSTLYQSQTYSSVTQGGSREDQEREDNQVVQDLINNLPRPKGEFLFRYLVPAASGKVGLKAGALTQHWLREGVPLLAGPRIAGYLPAVAGGAAQAHVFFNFSLGGMSLKVFSLSKAGVTAVGFTAKFGERAIGVSLAKAAGGVAIKAVSQKGAQVISTATFVKLGAALGSLAPVIGTVIGAIVGAIAGKVVPKALSWFKRHKGDIGAAIVTAAIAIPGVVFGIPLLIPIGIAAGGIMAAGGITAFVAGIGTFFSALFAMTLASIAAPIIISFISIPIIVAFILFIINSGAYMVPPAPGQIAGAIISPYIDVKKVASPKTTYENSELPFTVKYTITIAAKKSTLTNIKIVDTCSVVRKGPKIDCPPASPILPQPPSQISQLGGAFTFEYTRTFTLTPVDYRDSLNADTITVTADVPEQAGVKASASIGIRIGKPPDECPYPWPVDGVYRISSGPDAPGTHKGIEAIDIAVSTGTNVRATHSGVATVYNVGSNASWGPNYVEIESNCGGVVFKSRYAHLLTTSITNGPVVLGQSIGTSDAMVGGTWSTGPHLHYEFINLRMAPPNIRKSVPYGCKNSSECGNTD